MKAPFWRAAAVAVALAACSGQVFAHGYRHHHGGYYGGSGWWIGGALLGAGVALALNSGPRYGYSGVTYAAPPVYYGPSYVAPAVTYVTPASVVSYSAPQLAVAASNLHVVAYPATGQSESQQLRDRHECQRWAMNQSGLDPDNITEYTTGASVESYTRALGACFKGRGYSIN